MKYGLVVCCLAAVLAMAVADPVAAQNDVQSRIEQLEQQLADIQRQLEEMRATGAPATNEQLQSDVEQLQEVVTEPEGAIQTTIADVAKLKKIKVSGYLQARYENYEKASGRPNTANNSSSDDRFYLRRGRFKITGQPTDKTVGVVQLDISGYDRGKVESKDLYLEYHPWGIGVPAPFFVRFGQMNWPFGYAIERSSSARETPERPKIFAGTTVSLPGYATFNGLFPGERDKGIALYSTETSKVDWSIGLFNGAGTKSSNPGSTFLESGGRFEDNNSDKAIVGRARYGVLSNLDIGASIYLGSDAVRQVSNATSAVDVDKTRFGIDAQWYLPGITLKAEYLRGKEPYYSNTTTTPNGLSGTNRTISGWYALAVKDFYPYQLVAQYDVLQDRGLASKWGTLSTWNLGVIRFLDDATKVKLFYEINDEENNSISNDGLRFEVLTSF